MAITEKQIADAKRRYEEHFDLPFPKYVLFQVGHPSNLEDIDEIFEEDLKSVNEAIRENKPFDETLLKNIAF